MLIYVVQFGLLTNSDQETTAVPPDSDFRQLLIFTPEIWTSPEASSRAAKIIADVARIAVKFPWCSNFQFDHFVSLSQPDRSEAIIRGVIEEIARLSSSGSTRRWTFDIDKNARNLFHKLLLAAGAKVIEVQSDHEPVSELIDSIRSGSIKRAKDLIDRQINLETYSGPGLTYLMQASVNGKADIANLLLKHGASIEAENPVGKTALSIAAEAGSIQVIDTLLRHGAQLETKSLRGETPLMFAANSGKHNCVEKLLEAGANLNSHNLQEKSALDFAKEKGHPLVVDLLKRAA